MEEVGGTPEGTREDGFTGVQRNIHQIYYKICICVCVNSKREKERRETVGETQGNNQSDGVSESTNTRQMRFKWSLRVKQKTREDIEGNVFH